MLLSGNDFVVLVNNDWVTVKELYEWSISQATRPILRGVTLVPDEADKQKLTTDWLQTPVTIDKVDSTSHTFRYVFKDLPIDITKGTLLSTFKDRYIDIDAGKQSTFVVLAFKTMLTVDQPESVEFMQIDQTELYEINLIDPIYIFVGSYNRLYKNYSIAVCVK